MSRETEDERQKRLRTEHDAHIATLLKGGTGRKMQSSIAGASSKTSELYRQGEAQEYERQRALLEAALNQQKAEAFVEDAEARKNALNAQRENNKKKRDKKKQRATGKRERSASRSSAEETTPKSPSSTVKQRPETNDEEAKNSSQS